MLTERRNADRQVMARQLILLAQRQGAAAAIVAAPLSPRAVWVEIEAARGLKLTVDFDGQSTQPDVHVLSWHIGTAHDTKLAPAVWESVNPHHFAKATDIAYGFGDLLDLIARRLRSAADGTAFQ